ncbi:MAG: hypothetical protein N2234_07820 [Planctomycetota bacterium]|nr:hypothetical protein [Planctomycetota bacterium]
MKGIINRNGGVIVAGLLLILLNAGVAGEEKTDNGEQRQNNKKRDEERKNLEKEVEEALKKGVKWLIPRQRKEGAFDGAYEKQNPMGMTALCIYALLSADAEGIEEAVEKGFRYLGSLPLKSSYCTSLLLLAVEAKFRKEAMKRNPTDWENEEKKVFGTSEKPYKNIVTNCVLWLRNGQRADGMWSYDFSRGRGDGSNTQFVLLALDAARRLGVDIPVRMFEKAIEGILATQQKTGRVLKKEEWFNVPAADYSILELKERASKKRGENLKEEEEDVELGRKDEMKVRGMGYMAGQAVTYSMTAAGLAGLVVCKSALEEANCYGKYKRVDVAIRDAAAYLAVEYPYKEIVKQMPRGRGTRSVLCDVWDFYRLYSLERAGAMAVVERFGENDWYSDGAKLLLKEQMEDGSWCRCTVCTSFAILFLSRSTVAPVKKEDMNRGKEIPLPAPLKEKQKCG